MSCENKKISRRKFLARSGRTAAGIFGAVALGSCTNPQISGTGKPGSKMRFGLTTYQWGRDMDLPTLIATCTKAQAFGVELRTSKSHAHGVELTLSAQQRRDVKKLFATAPVTLVGLATGERLDSPDPAKLKEAIENIKAYVKLSRDIGATGVRVFPNSFHEGVPREKTIEQIGKSLNIVGAFAADYGQRIGFEVHGQCRELPTIKAIMDYVTAPAVGVKWNCNRTDAEGKGLEYNFNLVKDRLGDTVHLHNLKSGKYPYQQLVNLFVKMDYAGWILLEGEGEGRHLPEDRVKAIIEQRQLWEQMVANAQALL